MFRSIQIALRQCETEGRQGRELGASVVSDAPLPAKEAGNENYPIPWEPRQDVACDIGLPQVDLIEGLSQLSLRSFGESGKSA
jgi:hypothetical protein